MSLLEGSWTGRSCQRLAESDRGKACRRGGSGSSPQEPPTDMDEEPLGLRAAHTACRPGANGAGFSETLLREPEILVKEWSCLGGAQGKRYLGNSPRPQGAGRAPSPPERAARAAGRQPLSLCKLVRAASQPLREKSHPAGASPCQQGDPTKEASSSGF